MLAGAAEQRMLLKEKDRALADVRHAVAIADAEQTTTQTGTCTWWALIEPWATSASVITPIVFWASLVPWAIATAALVTIWPRRKARAVGPGLRRPNSQ